MSDTMRSALLFLINTVFDLYLFILMIRLILAFVGANYFDPITQFAVRLTDPLVKPVRRYIPNLRRIEISTLLIILLIEMIKFFIIGLLSFGVANFFGLIIISFADILKLLLQVFFYAILLQAVLSWIQPHSPANKTLYQLTYPIVAPFRKIIPLVGGFDISPIPALILLQLLIIVVVNPLMAIGLNIAFG